MYIKFFKGIVMYCLFILWNFIYTFYIFYLGYIYKINMGIENLLFEFRKSVIK